MWRRPILSCGYHPFLVAVLTDTAHNHHGTGSPFIRRGGNGGLHHFNSLPRQAQITIPRPSLPHTRCTPSSVYPPPAHLPATSASSAHCPLHPRDAHLATRTFLPALLPPELQKGVCALALLPNDTTTFDIQTAHLHLRQPDRAPAPRAPASPSESQSPRRASPSQSQSKRHTSPSQPQSLRRASAPSAASSWIPSDVRHKPFASVLGLLSHALQPLAVFILCSGQQPNSPSAIPLTCGTSTPHPASSSCAMLFNL